MPLTDLADSELLQRYVRREADAEKSFAQLVERHLNLVYSVALRHVRSSQLAEDVAQSVFIDLSRQAARIDANTPLVAWLHLVSRRTAVDTVRRESRRRAREHEAAVLVSEELANPAMKSTSPDWAVIEPVLDEAVESLSPSDRTAILLRFFENKSLREVGAALCASEDAAQKRVTRALDQLRAFFARRGVAISAAGLASDLSARAIETAPAALGETISATAIIPGATGSSALLEAVNVITLSSLQKTALISAVLVATGIGVYEAALIQHNRSHLEGLRQKNETVVAEIRRLRTSRDGAARQLASVEHQIDARLAATTSPSSAEDRASEARMEEWLAQVERLRQMLATRSNLNIPELQLLTEQDWFDVAAASRFESDEDVRRAAATLRWRADNAMGNKLTIALNTYIAAHDGRLPADPRELAPFMDAPVMPDWLQRYEMLHTGKLDALSKRERDMHLMAVKVPADVEHDMFWQVGALGGTARNAMVHNVDHAQRLFAKANHGQRATVAPQLTQYLKWPVESGALQKFLTKQARRSP